jgi:hypothetical protein
MKTALALLVTMLGLGFALNTASCSDQNDCATSSGGSGGTSCVAGNSTAGSAGAAATTCGQLTALQACFSAFCAADGIGTPFCTCYGRGFDLHAQSGDDSSCTCIPIDGASFCAQAAFNGLDGSDVDCTSATAPLVSMCVGVQ